MVCNEVGEVMTKYYLQTESPCEHCEATGRQDILEAPRCDDCNGTGKQQGRQEVIIELDGSVWVVGEDGQIWTQ